MARIPRENMNDSSFFHIMVQGINKEYIFNTRKYMGKYLDLIYKNSEKITIIAYCIMNNHAHFLIRTESIGDIENWMRKSNTSYAMYYNKNNERVGYVFRDRYKVQIIKNMKHLYLCAEYIHANPVKAGMVIDKNEYEFSSYRKLYLGDQKKFLKKLSKLAEQNIEQIINNNKSNEEEFKLIEEEKIDKEEICDDIINIFLKENAIDLTELRKNKEILKLLIKTLKDKNNISYRIMERHLKISRETLRKITNTN